MVKITINQLLKQGLEQLKNNSNTPILDTELLFIHTMEKFGYAMDKIKIITCGGNEVEEKIFSSFMSKIYDRKMGKPVQYITEKQEFMGLDLYINDGVLIPRPDTEIVVENILKKYNNKHQLAIMDMCTGSGAIALSLAKYMPQSFVWAVDISDKALECCKVNAKKHKLDTRVKIIKSDIFENINKNNFDSVDLIVSNPPYIQRDEIQKLSKSVKEYEPNIALDGGKDGLFFYRKITIEGARYIKSKGLLVFEIGYNQGEAVRNILQESGFFREITIEKDLAGLDRCMIAIRK